MKKEPNRKKWIKKFRLKWWKCDQQKKKQRKNEKKNESNKESENLKVTVQKLKRKISL